MARQASCRSGASSPRSRSSGHGGDWWDPNGASAMLHKLNPVRLGYIRDQDRPALAGDECSRRPLAGKSALDVGCGAGLLAEPLARLGAKVTAIDAAPELIAVARDHAARRGWRSTIAPAAVEALDGRSTSSPRWR
jgi:2-polyprenyl-6-hydroxyphenyl methylase/3-demethylubiquinone-9 3-methyltransferase